jgi:hypothetical protein
VTLRARLAARLSPERTRRATLGERLTVRRMSWATLVRLNLWLEVVGRAATALWIALLVSLAAGVDWRPTLEDAFNAGRPISGAVLLLVVLVTAPLLLARSVVGFARWRLQRELWRRDVERFTSPPPP